MLGLQSSILLSPTSKSMSSSTINPLLASNPLLSSSIDEKSQKDIVEILNKCIDNTRNLTEFSKVLQIDNINAPTISGHTDFYYPNLTFQVSHYQQELPEITKIKHIPIPPELLEQFSQMQINCSMGLFTCISRAWLTIDNLIFFWNYEDGSDICFYDNLSEPILAVELFVPRAGTFDDGVEYGLCLATNSQVVLLSVDFIRFTKGNGAIVNEMRFSPQPVYSIPTDNLIINTLRASKMTGRIFMGAKDGSLYEFFYQNQTSWFSSQTKKINLSHSKFHYLVPSFFNFNDADSIVQIELDESRNILYTRSENSTIQVFFLGSNGLDTSKINYLTCNAIASKAAHLINSNDKHLFMPIIHISALRQTESKNINLVGVTQFGIRLYFSVSPFEQFQQLTSPDQQPPSTFQLVHVRIPPNIELTSQNRNGPVSSAYINNGISLMMTKRDEQNDSVLLLNRDLFVLHSNFKESKTIFDIDGRIWNCEEIVPSLSSIRTAALENDLLQTIKSASNVEDIPKLTAEYFDMPRRFAMITPQGCFIWSKLRPIDQLTICLRESNGPNSDSVRLFFNKIYEKSEACALCLAVALSHSNDARVYEWATQAYFMYSGEPEIRKKSTYNFGVTNSITQSNPQSNQPFHNLIDSGVEQNENSMYGDMTLINKIQPKTTAFNSVSILNSPQQMSTPIVMRTKDQFQSARPNPFRVQTQPPQQQNMNPPVQKNECEIYFSGKHDAIYIYLSRLMLPIWDLKFLNELPGSRRLEDSDTFNLAESTIFATFADINIQWFLQKLNELRNFIELNYPQLKTIQHSQLTGSLFGLSETVQSGTPGSQRVIIQPKFATHFQNMPLNLQVLVGLTSSGLPLSEEKIAVEIEMGSIYLIKQFLNRIIEIFGLWKILDDHKFHFISTKLDRQTQMLLMNMQIKNFLLSDDNLLDQLITALLYRYIDDNACTDLLNQTLKQMCPSLYTNENAIFSKACEKLKQALNIKNDTYERDRLLKEAVELLKQIGFVANLGQVCDMLYTAGCYEVIFELALTAAEKRDPQNIALYYYRKNEPPEDVQGEHYFNLRTECYKSMLDCLNNLVKTPVSIGQKNTGLTKEKLEDQINYLIRYVVSSKDELAQVSLFNWMITIGFEKKLVTLDSPFLENYLIKQVQNQNKNRVYLDLLWRHYDYKKEYTKAAKVLTMLAEKDSASPIGLRERVEYLTQAIVALNSSQKSSVKDEIAELNDKKDVALLQEKIYDELSRLEPRTESVQEALNQLDSQLYDITKLYYDFADKFELYHCQMAIFRMSRHEDTKAIEVLWKQIIANEMDKLNRPDLKLIDLKHQLAENIISIAKEYIDDEKYFPLTTLIDSLEFVSLSRGFEPEWCCNLLRKLNLTFEQLIQAYHQVYLRKDIKWAENSSRFINAIYCLIELFTKAPRATSETDKVFFLKSVKDLIPKYLTELNAINDELSKELINGFKSLNCMIDRM